MTAALPPLAVIGGRLATSLQDVTTDLSALDSHGFWVLVADFEGPSLCARFAEVRPAGRKLLAYTGWRGPPTALWTSSLHRPDFYDGVARIRAAIAAGSVYQVNLCRVLSAPAPQHSDIAALGATLSVGNPAPYAAVVRLPRQDVHVASASPELFLRREADHVESRPIKGTAAPGQAFSIKDHAENVMIVDLVRNDLGRVCVPGTIEVPAICAIESHPGVDHMVSTVRGRLRQGVSWSELLEATFPPGSVTGAPKLAALEIIRGLEPVPRGPYCGSIGWIDADAQHGALSVGIRTFWLRDGHLRVGTGAGITWGSTPHGEWSETQLKMQRLLALASEQCPSPLAGHGELSSSTEP